MPWPPPMQALATAMIDGAAGAVTAVGVIEPPVR